jgi:IPT/TIG domain
MRSTLMSSHRIARATIGGILAIMTLGCSDGRNFLPPGRVQALTVTSINPRIGLTTTPTTVQISGTGFRTGTAVIWDGVPLTVTVVSSSLITATVPAHAAGHVDVVVSNNVGKEIVSLSDAFSYLQLEIASVSPVAGLAGELVRITGNGFRAGAGVTFGGVRALAVNIQSPTTMWATLPLHAGGTVDVAVVDPEGATVAIPGGFTFEQVTLTIAPEGVTPGASVTMRWSAPAGRSGLDWIGLFRVGDDSFNYEEFWWAYTAGASTGTRTIAAPTQPGAYQFRYFVNDGYVDATRSAVLTVTAAPGPSRE